MTTIANRKSADSSHWYFSTGEPCYELPKKDGSGMKVPTLADARKLNLLPSVTTILKILHKQALVEWLCEQTALAIVTTPRLPDETDDAFVYRVLHIEKHQDQESQAARDRGTEIHAALEAMFTFGGPVDAEILPWVEPVYTALAKRGEVIGIEKCIVGEGYAGKLDLQLQAPDGVIWLFDYKTSKKLPDKPWLEAKMQLAAYAKSVYDNMNTPVRVCVVYVSTSNPGECKMFEEIEWKTEYENGFAPLHKAWMHLNGYVPANMD